MYIIYVVCELVLVPFGLIWDWKKGYLNIVMVVMYGNIYTYSALQHE